MRKLCLKVLEPLILDHRPGVSNEHETLDYIPASRLRGAIFEALPQLNPNLDPEKLFGFDGPRWSDAWPASKEFEPFRRLPRCPDQNGGLPNNRARNPWGHLEANTLRQQIVKREMNMGVSRYYDRHSHRPGALYAREAISPGQRFVAYVDCDDLPVSNGLKLNLGTRRSANGRCSLSIEEHEDWDKITGSAYEDFRTLTNSIAIQMLSDAIVPGPFGGYQRGLDEAALTRLAGFPLTLHASYSARKIVAGWSGAWNLPRESAVAIEAGSVWLVQAADSDRGRLFEFAGELVKRGMGIRTCEGYGTAAINPPWLNLVAPENGDLSSLNFAFEEFEADVSPKDATPWPELEGISNHELTALAAAAKAAANKFEKTPDVRPWISAAAKDPQIDVTELKGLTLSPEERSLVSNAQKNAKVFFLCVLETSLNQTPEQAK
jgi:hypothetical protein